MATSLSPAESLIILNPNRTSGREAIKVTLLWLMAQGLVVVEEITQKRWIGSGKLVYVRPGRKGASLPPHAASLMEQVRSAQADAGQMKDLVARAQKAYGANLSKFKNGLIMPGLVSRGLVNVDRFLLVFRRWQLTHEGLAEQSRIKGDIDRARTIPALLHSDPAEAAAIALAVGSNILLVEELRPHYRQLSEAMRSYSGNDGADGSYVASGEACDHSGRGDMHPPAPAVDPGGLGMDPGNLGSLDVGNLDLGGFDASAFDALDAGMASFDSGFDSAAGGDSGGDGGGGDGGGGGGD
jgi:hypothetical protein